jgi:GT2 family glycosyltransferase
LSLIAAICTNRTPPAVQPALAAVCEQVAGAGDCSALLVTSGLDESAAALHAESAARLGARAVRAPAGLSLARNRALEEAQDADLIAFVDDDTLPQDGWLEALLERWRRASPEVACIGGAILPRWQRPPPAWVGRGLDEAFSLLDLGPGLVELDPLHGHDAWGANISFRAGRVREVGGFDAGRGAWSGVPLFGDESAVQRRLAERGYRVLYAGDVRVEHLIGAERLRLRQLWRRELYRGASAAIDGRASAWGGAALAAKAAAGMLIAALRGDRTLAAERLARLARSSGAASSPLIRRRLRRRGWPGA